MVPFDYEKEYADKGPIFMEGYKARLNGVKDDQAPYPEGSNEEDTWLDGWIKADFDDEEDDDDAA